MDLEVQINMDEVYCLNPQCSFYGSIDECFYDNDGDRYWYICNLCGEFTDFIENIELTIKT